ncbi:MAG: sensor histidine kinase [Rickettsiaceae bacterium]|nr:sensor histidine kinase [Rickettsiaceae bacterium]
MNKNRNYKEKKHLGYNLNIHILTIIIIFVVICLTLLYFFRTYHNNKELVLQELKIEASNLGTVLTDRINYSQYFIRIISKSIKEHHNDTRYIRKLLQENFKSRDLNYFFGWRKYSWVNKDFKEVATSNKNFKKNFQFLKYVKDIVKTPSKRNPYGISFYTGFQEKERKLKIIDSIVDGNSNKYIGSVILSYDIGTLVRSLNSIKRNIDANFIIIDTDYNVIARSKEVINNVVDENGLANNLKSIIKDLKIKQSNSDHHYLDMINGINYYIKPLGGLPFIIIVNIDDNVIKQNILDSVARRFIEVAVLAIVCFFSIVSLYKREAVLREKAEKATIVANNATQAKTDFLAFTAHEVRSPLGFILTGSEIMKKELLGNLPAAYMKYAEGIHQNSKIILDFITDILDDNQIIEGRFRIVNSTADIKSIIKEAIKVNLARYNQRKITVNQKLSKDLPLVICDKRRMLQIFSNLVSNAIKYSNDNTNINIVAELVEETIVITVIDEGIGMDEHEIEIALSTYGIVGSNSHSRGSYGLGLPIVKMLLDAHDASLIITSKKGEGTKVKIIFPKIKLVYGQNNNK